VRHTYRAEWSPEDAEYVGFCAEFPSLSWLHSLSVKRSRAIKRVVGEVVVDTEAAG
jgi:hypothetical protein